MRIDCQSIIKGKSWRRPASLPVAVVLFFLLPILAAWPAAARGQVSLQVKTKGGTRLGNAFFVTNEGLVATSFALVQDATKASLILPGDQSCDVSGVVAASRAHDVAILIVKKPPKSLAKEQIGFAVQPEFAAGERLFPRFGPLQQPPQDQLTVPGAVLPPPVVARRMDAQMLRLGYENRSAVTPGLAGEMNWVVLDRGFDTSAAGAPLWDAKFNRIQGMLTSLMGSDQRTRLVLPIEHVVNLIPPGKKPKFRPLSELRRWEDSWLQFEPNDSEAIAAAQRVRKLTQRLSVCQEQWNLAEQAIGPAEQFVVKVEPGIQPLRSKVAEQREKIAMIESSPEEKYVVKVISSVLDKMTCDAQGVPYIWDSSAKPGSVKVAFRLSARQQAEVSALWAAIANDFRTLVDRNLELQYAKAFTLPHVQRAQDRARDELFLLADPCELRGPDDHRELLAQLNDIIEQRGALGEFFLARGLCKLRLRQLAEAQSDFREAAELDVKLQPLANLAEARRLFLLHDEKGSQEWQKKALAGSLDPQQRDGKLSFLLARIEIDQGNTVAAAHHLERSLTAGIDPLEVHLVLAWLHASPPGGQDANARQSVAHAKAAIAIAGSLDWLSLAALAAAQARQRDFTEAEKAVTRAAMLAPPEFADRLAQWKAEIAEKKPLKRDW
ncbi:MAG: hypothetical protein AB7O62_08110 [Pirellulales bacterium]